MIHSKRIKALEPLIYMQQQYKAIGSDLLLMTQRHDLATKRKEAGKQITSFFKQQTLRFYHVCIIFSFIKD
jgi:hypothetical protein